MFNNFMAKPGTLPMYGQPQPTSPMPTQQPYGFLGNIQVPPLGAAPYNFANLSPELMGLGGKGIQLPSVGTTPPTGGGGTPGGGTGTPGTRPTRPTREERDLLRQQRRDARRGG